MHVETIHETVPGTTLASVRYEPEQAHATILALPGIGIRKELFARFGHWQAARGTRVVSIDWTGVGDSPMPAGEGRRTDLTTWARRDAVAALRSIRARFEGPVVLVAHSFGGQAVAIADELQQVDAIVMVASQTPWYGFYHRRIATFFFGSYRLLGPWLDQVPGWLGVGTPLPGGVVSEWARWGRSRGTYFTHVDGATERLARLNVPVLAYSFPDDPMATPGGVRDLLDKIPAEVLEHRVVAPHEVGLDRIGHVGFFKRTELAGEWRRIADLVDGLVQPARQTA